MNNVNGVGYIWIARDIGAFAGVTTRPDKRVNEHKTAVENKKHFNKNFQDAVNKYGLDKFVYIVTNPVPWECLAALEQALFDVAKVAGENLLNIQQRAKKPHPVGYTLSADTKAKQSASKRKDYTFVSPDGEIVRVNGLDEFCKKNGLSTSQMSRVASGKARSHKGWTRYN